MAEANDTAERNRNFFNFGTEEAYGLYFGMLSSLVKKLMLMFGAGEGQDTYEARMTEVFLAKFLYTIQALRIKFAYSPAHNRRLWVDLSESGFPNHAEIAKLETDMLSKEEQLRDIPTGTQLKLQLLDHMFTQHADSKDLLWLLSERAYLELLKADQLFLAFTPGELVRQADTPNGRAYSYSWGCYDFETNRPYIHVMAFEQDAEQEPLEANGNSFRQLMKVVRAEGSRVPDLGILAFSIDDALEPIHPKILKRVGIGPLYSPLTLNGHVEEREAQACSLLTRYTERTDEFLVHLIREVVFSKSQQVSRSILASRNKVREIFYIPQTDSEAYRRRVSLVEKSALMPHIMLQHVSSSDREAMELTGVRVMTYDERGEVHGT